MGLSSSKKEVIKQENVETNSKQNYSTTTENTSTSFYKTNKEIRRNENILKGKDLKSTNQFINKVSRSICKLEVIRNGNIPVNGGTGFLIKLNFNNDQNYKYFLMTCEHVVKRNFIQDENLQIEVNYDSGFKNLQSIWINMQE